MKKNIQKIIIAVSVTFVRLFFTSATTTGSHSKTTSIIPIPVSIEHRDGFFVLIPTIQVIAAKDAEAEASKLIDLLAPAMGYRLQLSALAQSNHQSIKLELDKQLSQLGNEGYILEIFPRQILIRARQPTGLFYGIRTLLQLLPTSIFSKTEIKNINWKVPCLKITDYPRFRWRGLLVDPARHFIPKTALLKFIDTMALQKLNRLQIHLTDDQGWLVEIKKYPKLNEIGSWRDETLIGHLRHKPWQFDGKPHGGFYTQDDIREIIHYALARHIRIVPEIEMPGHARAAISSYPKLGVFPEKQKLLKPWTHWGISEHIFAPRRETILFLQDVLLEIMNLFPDKYLHIGGDEAIKNQWKASEEIQTLIRKKGLKPGT